MSSEKEKKILTTDDKLNLLIKQNKAMQQQLTEQSNLISELKTENKKIMENTLKMGKHIDFINGAYEKVTKSYLFKNVFS